MQFGSSHLAYCTNIHPAETWEETRRVLETHVLAVRDLLLHGDDDASPALLPLDGRFGIGLRLSALAARELLGSDHLARFKDWLEATGTYVFTINGFPYGGFHGTRVKEAVFQPDWTDSARVGYTRDLFRILAAIAMPGTGASVSTLPGSHKTFHADESLILRNLSNMALWLDDLSAETGHDLHLGLEPEPLGHFENTVETLAFFDRLRANSASPESVSKRIGVNFDTCHFALEYDETGPALDALTACGIRISKIHLSSAISFDPRDPAAVEAIRGFDEPTYFHQVLVRTDTGEIRRFVDLPDFLSAAPIDHATAWVECRCTIALAGLLA